MNRLLIIAPHFPPTNAPDMHRARILAPHLIALGWEVHVLAVTPECVVNERDDWLADGLPAKLHVHRVKGLGTAWTRVPGLGGIGTRCFLALKARARQLLADRHFTAIFFSTTVIEAMALGPSLKREFKVPYVLDYQDPWTTDQYKVNGQRPPGGHIKYWLASTRAKLLEAQVVREAGGIVSVSPYYIEQLRSTYGCKSLDNSLVAPFPIDSRSVGRISEEQSPQSVFTPGSTRHQWVYTGVIIDPMRPILRAFFAALARHLQANTMSVKVLFIGTSYGTPRSGHHSIALECASDFQLNHITEDYPQRISYQETLACQRDATALLAFGTTDASYVASKMSVYLSTRKPLLSIYHHASPMRRLMPELAAATAIWFDPSEEPRVASTAIAEQWLAGGGYRRPTRPDLIQDKIPYPESQAVQVHNILLRAANATTLPNAPDLGPA